MYTKQEAFQQLNQSSFTKYHAKWRIDKFKQYAIDPYYAGLLVMDHQVKIENGRGLHEPMITLQEHEAIVRLITGTTKKRGSPKQYNPEFPMNKILTCGNCAPGTKFTGSKKNNGYAKRTIKYYWKYSCRGCGKAFHRDDVHIAISERLNELEYTGQQRGEFIKALQTVWEQKQRDKLQYALSLQKQLDKLNNDKSAMVQALVTAEDDLKDDFKAEVSRIKSAIANTELKLREASDLQEDLIDFIKFSLEYTNILKDDWWLLDHENRVRCQQLLLPGGISFNAQKKVGTPEISPLYRLQAKKKALNEDRNSLMVELAGTAPASAGLSWLVVYRHSQF
jgi:hypothetical protein